MSLRKLRYLEATDSIMEYVIEDPSSDKSTLNSAQSSIGTAEPAQGLFVAHPEPEFFSPSLAERLRSDEAFLRQPSKHLDQRREEADRIHHTHDEKERLAALEASRRSAGQHAQQKTERERKLLAQIDALREVEAQQRRRIEEAHAATRRLSAEESQNDLEIEPPANRQAEEEEAQLAQLEELHAAAESQASARAAETERLGAEIRTLSQVASQQIDRMDQAKARLAILEELRIHAETKVCERAEREIRLEAEIDALRQIEGAQDQRIEAAEEELRRLAEEQTSVQAAAEANRRSEAEARKRIAAEAAQKAADEARRLAEEADQELERLEAIRARAEAAAQERAERERLLNSELLAFGEAAAEQLKRIESAEANLSRAEKELLQLKERGRQTVEQAASQASAVEKRRQTLADEVAVAEEDAQAIAKEKEQQLAELQAIRTRAEAEAKKRAELERQLNADVEALREAEAKQLRRIEKAKTVAQKVSQEVTQLLRIAKDEEQRLVELESARKEFETTSQSRYEEEQRLMAEIEALREIVSEQQSRIAAAEVALRTREKELRAAEAEISQEQVEPQTASEPDINGASEMWPEDLESEKPEPESATQWSMFEPGEPANGKVAETVEPLSNVRVDLPLENTLTLTAETATEDSPKPADSVVPEEIQAVSQETPLINSLAQRLSSGDHEEYAKVVEDLGRLDSNAAFDLITGLFDDKSAGVRNVAARALFDLGKERADFFTRALREASPERTRQIVAAVEASGIADEAIDRLAGESREKTHDAFSMLFLLAKAGEVQSLFHTIEKHPNIHVRLSVIKLLTFTNRPDIIPALRSLAVRGALPIEVRSALMKSIYEMSSGNRQRSLTAA
jgi:colicin import membrane protein